MKIFYLAHNFGTRKKIRKWELRIEGKYNIQLDNPFYDNPNRAEEMRKLDKMKEGSKEMVEFLGNRNDIDNPVDNDLEKIRKSDGIVAFVVASKKFATMIGTPMEVFFAANTLRIPVYVITNKFAFHPWIKKFATMIFRTRKEFEEYIKIQYGVKE